MDFQVILFLFAILILCPKIDAKELNDSDCICRLPNSGRKIIGGREVKKHINWMVSLALIVNGDEIHLCGGTIINHHWILTSAHCENEIKNIGGIQYLEVRVGMIELNQTHNVQRFKAKRFIKDSRYDLNGKVDQIGDIGFVEIDGEIQFSKTVSPGCFHHSLKDEKQNYADRIGSLHAVGFGILNRHLVDKRTGRRLNFTLSNRLKEAFFNDISFETDCPDYLICIKQVKFPDSTCGGDSGGGLMHQNKDGKIKIIGVNSFGKTIDVDKDHYMACIGESSFSRITYYRKLFKKVVGNYCILN